jgi:hypothetical protein
MGRKEGDRMPVHSRPAATKERPPHATVAGIAEERFDPARGLDFSTLLRKWLLGLNRYGKRKYRLKNGIMSRRQKVALGVAEEEPLENWKKENRKREAERKRLVGWGNRRPDEMVKFGFEITDYRYGQRRGDGSNYRTWKAGIGPFGSNGMARLDEAVKEIIGRRRLTKKQHAMLDWMVGNLAGRDNRTMAQAASDAGVTRGYASKVVSSIASDINYW